MKPETLISNLQGKYQKHEAFEAEVQAKSRVLPDLEETRETRFPEGHFAHEDTKVNKWQGSMRDASNC